LEQQEFKMPEPHMQQLGFLDFDIRLDRINKAGNPID